MVLSEESTEKIPSDPGTVRLVQQHLNHYATPGPYLEYVSKETGVESDH